VVTIAAPFQFDIQGIMTRDDVPNLGALKDKTILVAGTGTTYWWPWVKKKYGYTDAQMRPYTFNLQPFFNDPNIVQQAFPSSEPYQADQKGVKTKFFLLSAEGYPPYTQAITHDAEDGQREARRGGALRQGHAGRLEELHGKTRLPATC
jgi:NitT/TauT family transport system substrate-binding protein